MITPTSCYTCDMLHDIFIRIRDDVVDVQWVILVVWYATCVCNAMREFDNLCDHGDMIVPRTGTQCTQRYGPQFPFTVWNRNVQVCIVLSTVTVVLKARPWYRGQLFMALALALRAAATIFCVTSNSGPTTAEVKLKVTVSRIILRTIQLLFLRIPKRISKQLKFSSLPILSGCQMY